MDLHALIEVAARDPVLLFLSLIVGVLFAMAIIFAFMTVFLRISNTRTRKRREGLEREWRPILMEILSAGQPASALQKRVQKRDRAFFMEFLARYAGRVKGGDRRTLMELARPFVRLVTTRWKRGDAEQRAHSLYLMSTLGLPEFGKEVQSALSDSSPLVAMIAARGLARQEHPELAEGLLDMLHRFDAWSTGFLATMLSNVGIPLAAKLRAVLADSSRPPRTRAVAAEALSRLKDLTAADVAMPLLETENDADLLASVLRLTAAVGRREHIDLVRPHCDSKNFSVRTQAIAALGSLGDMQEVPMLRRAFMDHSPWVAIQAAWALKKVGAGEILTALAESRHPRAELARQVLAGHR